MITLIAALQGRVDRDGHTGVSALVTAAGAADEDPLRTGVIRRRTDTVIRTDTTKAHYVRSYRDTWVGFILLVEGSRFGD